MQRKNIIIASIVGILLLVLLIILVLVFTVFSPSSHSPSPSSHSPSPATKCKVFTEPSHSGWDMVTDLIPDATVDAASNGCGNIFFYGASTVHFDTLLYANLSIDKAAPKSSISADEGTFMPFKYNPNYNYGWDVLFNFGNIKEGQYLSIEAALGVKATKKAQRVTACFYVKKCGADMSDSVLIRI